MFITDTVYIYDTVYIDTTMGVDGAEMAAVKLYGENGQIVVEGAEGNDVVLYDVVGRRLEGVRAWHGQAKVRFDVPASGAYLVRIGNRPARRIVVIK